MREKTKARLIAEDYCKQYVDIKHDMVLARKILKENSSDFRNLEHARSMVREIRGHHGKGQLKRLGDKSLVTPTHGDTTVPPKFKDEIKAKVLILDIETAPIMAYVWGIWQQNVQLNQIASDWFCLTWAAKWLFEDKVYSGKVTAKEAKAQDDKRMIKGIWELINEADVVIAHNGAKFDMPKLNTRFVIHGMQPPLPYQMIDTLTHIRRQFGFTSNKLDYVNKLLNLERKTDTGGFSLWERCMRGEQEAIAEMETYNVNDVLILEETYLKIRSWIKPHPNIGLFILDEYERCPSCGCNDLLSVGKNYMTTANIYSMFRCNNCGSSGRKRLSDITSNEKKHLLMSLPK